MLYGIFIRYRTVPCKAVTNCKLLPLKCFFFFNAAFYLITHQLSVSGNCLLNVPDSEEQDLGTTACSYKYKMHYYDPETNTCKRFTYGICVGKINRFFSRSACKKACIQSRTRATSQCTPLLLNSKFCVMKISHQNILINIFHIRIVTTRLSSPKNEKFLSCRQFFWKYAFCLLIRAQKKLKPTVQYRNEIAELFIWWDLICVSI